MYKTFTMTLFASLCLSLPALAATEGPCIAFKKESKADQEIFSQLIQERSVPNSSMSEETVRPLDLAAGRISGKPSFSYQVVFCNNNQGYKIIVF